MTRIYAAIAEGGECGRGGDRGSLSDWTVTEMRVRLARRFEVRVRYACSSYTQTEDFEGVFKNHNEEEEELEFGTVLCCILLFEV